MYIIEQFHLQKTFNVSDIEMFPNRGCKGSRVYFTAAILGEYDVYF